MNRTWKIAGINFDHFHMGDLLRLVHEHPGAELVGICDETPARMQPSVGAFGIPQSASSPITAPASRKHSRIW
jgi:glucose-fructose oxidoreductase